jgi:hypothetical protein
MARRFGQWRFGFVVMVAILGLGGGCGDGGNSAETPALGASCAGDEAASCSGGQRCAVVCASGSAAPRCEPDPGSGADIGELCDGLKTCRFGVCVADPVRTGPLPRCQALCASDKDCKVGVACKPVSLQYNCPTGRFPLALKFCLAK